MAYKRRAGYWEIYDSLLKKEIQNILSKIGDDKNLQTVSSDCKLFLQHQLQLISVDNDEAAGWFV